ncbi:hypothetical protein [Microbacterium trichothecenolyticum]|uniref:Uncharacterized protein n=1 Tax=Microbacterium trichothecenolyticum TaxID=69370 RepID=A0A0M2H7I8_MICTR|nr:hypothetical protein [Microbacterium trichothecenolyticum]KJL39904.1 hypothetical protein RS82_04117 [Microbacterium trichothecenolyticum]
MGVLMLDVGGRRADGGRNGKLWIAENGLDEWWDSAETEFDEESAPDGDGAYDPTEVTLGPRRFPVSLLADASSPEWAELDVRTWATGLAKKLDLGFRVFHAGRWLSLRNAKVRGKVRVRPNRRDLRLTDIGFTVWAADPRKYGRTLTRTVDAVLQPKGGMFFPTVDGSINFGERGGVDFPGVFRLYNPGTADYLPSFKVTGPLDGFTIRSEDYVITYEGAVAAGQTLTLSPFTGGRASLDGADVSINLTEAGWAPVDGGQTRGYRFTPDNPRLGARLIIDYPEGAWW